MVGPQGPLGALRAPLNETKLERALKSYFRAPPSLIFEPSARAVTHLYRVDEVFGEAPWTYRMRADRIDRHSFVLYRPQIVEDLVSNVRHHLQSSGKGIFLSGAQGIGKSYTLINLVRRLQASGDYLVTFVPNCDAWRDFDTFFKMVLESFECTGSEIDLCLNTDLVGLTRTGRQLIEAVDDTLEQLGKK